MMTLDKIRNVEFDRGRGYRAEEVDDFIDACADTVQQLLQEKEELNQKMKVLADKLVEYRNDEDSIRAALLNAQRTGDTVLREAEQKAREIVEAAQKEAETIRQEAIGRVDEQKNELERAQREVSAFKERMLAMYKDHLELLRLLPEVEVTPVEAAVEVAEPPAETVEETPAPAVQETSSETDVVVAPPVEVVVAVPEQEQEMKPVSRFSNLKFGNDYDISADDDDEPGIRRRKRK